LALVEGAARPAESPTVKLPLGIKEQQAKTRRLKHALFAQLVWRHSAGETGAMVAVYEDESIIHPQSEMASGFGWCVANKRKSGHRQECFPQKRYPRRRFWMQSPGGSICICSLGRGRSAKNNHPPFIYICFPAPRSLNADLSRAPVIHVILDFSKQFIGSTQQRDRPPALHSFWASRIQLIFFFPFFFLPPYCAPDDKPRSTEPGDLHACNVITRNHKKCPTMTILMGEVRPPPSEARPNRKLTQASGKHKKNPSKASPRGSCHNPCTSILAVSMPISLSKQKGDLTKGLQIQEPFSLTAVFHRNEGACQEAGVYHARTRPGRTPLRMQMSEIPSCYAQKS